MSPLCTTRRRPAFLDRLQPPDFRAVAVKGCFVYAYLRTADGTPYYIGVASNSYRPVGSHKCPVPKDRSRICVLRLGLSWEQALEWEIRYIRHYGRKCNGTGILRNLTDGGQGLLGMQHSEETRAKMSVAAKALCSQSAVKAQRAASARRTWADKRMRERMCAGMKASWNNTERRARQSESAKGKSLTMETRAKIAKAKKGKLMSEETRAKMSASKKGRRHSPETLAKIAAGRKGKKHTAETKAKMSAARKLRVTKPETCEKRKQFWANSEVRHVQGRKVVALTDDQVREALASAEAGSKIAARMGVSSQVIYDIRNGKTYKWVEREGQAALAAA